MLMFVRSRIPSTTKWLLAAGVVLITVASIPFAITLALWPRLIAVQLLGWWLPGLLLAWLWCPDDVDWPTVLILGLGLGWCWMVVIAILVHWVPGPIALWHLAGTYAAGSVLLLILVARRRPHTFTSVSRRWQWQLFAVLILGIVLRLPGLGYHEFHFDEVVVLDRAREAIGGEDDALARHTKGPGELAVGTVVYRALETATEDTARFPFGVASVGSILALAILGRRVFNRTIGFFAGILLAFNGFALGLSRIVQYQPAILLLTALTVLSAWEFSKRGESRWLALCGIFSAVGIVMHYEFGLLAPILLVLAWGGWQRADDTGAIVRTLAVVGIPCAALVAGAYVPLFLNPYFNETQNYLSIRIGGLRTFNGAFFVEMGTFYNSIYFFVGLLLLVVAGIWHGWHTARRRTLLLVLWFVPYALLYFFIVRFPGTHFYLLMESWSLLAALPLAVLATLPALTWRIGAIGIITGWLTISAGYLYLMFFRQNPEYLINYADERVPLYWAPYGENIPKEPRFGFPIRDGWQVLGVLAEWHYVGETYNSNERSRHLRWYLGGLERTDFDEFPDYIFISQHVQQENPDFHQGRLNGYQRVGDIYVRGEPRIAIWTRDLPPADYLQYELESFAPFFPGIVPYLDEWPDPPIQARDVQLGGAMTLTAAGIDASDVSRGETVHILLTWTSQRPLDIDYKLFVHVGVDEAGAPLTQWDGYPGLNTVRTSEWPAGERFHDHILLDIPATMPSGEHRIRVGLYDGATGQRLGNTAIPIGTITVR